MLQTMTMTTLVLYETIAGCQEAMGVLMAWCRYRQRLASAFSRRQQCIADGMPFVPSTRPENVKPSVEVITDDRLVADRYAQHDCPVWLLTAELEPFEKSATAPKVVEFHFETRAWSTGNTLPRYMANLVASDKSSPPGYEQIDDSGAFDNSGAFYDSGEDPPASLTRPSRGQLRDDTSQYVPPSPPFHVSLLDTPASPPPFARDAERSQTLLLSYEQYEESSAIGK